MGYVLFINKIMDKYDIWIYILFFNIEFIKIIINEFIVVFFEERVVLNIK